MASTKEKRKLKIVFMGTPEFAVAGLEKLVESGLDIVGVITAPDKPVGRGRKLSQSPVKKYALVKSIPVLQPTNLKNKVFLEQLKSLEANLQVVVAFRMLPKAVWEMPEYGTFNLHASLLPQYRGAAPINWAIINGETRTGASTFFIDEKIDTGAIILQKEIDVHENEYAGTLHDKLMKLGAALIEETVKAIQAGPVKTWVQPEIQDLKLAPKIYRNDCQINWFLPVREIYNLIRGLSPYPTAWTYFVNGQEKTTMKIFMAEKEELSHEFPIGHIIESKSSLKIAVTDGLLNLKKVQLPGKRRMEVKQLLNGFKIEKGAHVL